MSTTELEQELTISSKEDAKHRLEGAVGRILVVAAQDNFLSQAERESFAAAIRLAADKLVGAQPKAASSIDKDFHMLLSKENEIGQACAEFFAANPKIKAVNVEWKNGKSSIWKNGKRIGASEAGLTKLASLFGDAKVDGTVTVYRTKIENHDTSVLVW